MATPNPDRHRAFQAILPSTQEPNNARITCVTYNLLAEQYTKGNHHTPCLHRYLHWPTRVPKIATELDAYDADILCLQEVERPFMEGTLSSHFASNNYRSVYYARAQKPTDPPAVTVAVPGPGPGPEEGVVLAYKSDRFHTLATATLRFADLASPDTHTHKQTNTLPVAEGVHRLMLDKEDGAALALLQDRHHHNSTLLAVSTHLFWDPHYPEIKTLQAALLCIGIQDFLSHHCHNSNNNMPIIIGGDFNSLPIKTKRDIFDPELDQYPGGTLISGVYQLMTTGSVDATHQDHPYVRHLQDGSNGAGGALTTAGVGAFASAMAQRPLERNCKEPLFTVRSASFQGCLDYIFYYREWFDVVEVLEMPYEDEEHLKEEVMRAFGPIPDEAWPSDHLAVGCRLQWKS